MRFICRLVGHNVGGTQLVRDPFTFAEYGVCKHCRAPMQRSDRQGWGPSQAIDLQPRAGRASLPPVMHRDDVDHIDDGEGKRLSRGPYAKPEVRAAYRRGVLDFYERSLDKRLAPHRGELSSWLESLDGWQGGDPPPPPQFAELQLAQISATPQDPHAADPPHQLPTLHPMRASGCPTQSMDLVFVARVQMPVQADNVAVVGEGENPEGEAAGEKAIADDQLPDVSKILPFRERR